MFAMFCAWDQIRIILSQRVLVLVVLLEHSGAQFRLSAAVVQTSWSEGGLHNLQSSNSVPNICGPKTTGKFISNSFFGKENEHFYTMTCPTTTENLCH